jgi:hypothetical protein
MESNDARIDSGSLGNRLCNRSICAEGPTMDQCKMGWKADYSKMWTKAQFKKACHSMMKSGGNM